MREVFKTHQHPAEMAPLKKGWKKERERNEVPRILTVL